MKQAKALILAILCMTALFFLNLALHQSTGTEYGSKGKISIVGTTNVNSFTLDGILSRIIISPDAVIKENQAGNTGKFWFRIPAKNFTCSNQQIYNDFLELIKAREHPNILIGFSSADIHRICANPGVYFITTEVKLAGRVSSYKVRCSVVSGSSKQLTVSGVQDMKLTDFQITPPQKLFGLIKVNNEILVNFAFNVTILES